METRKRVTLLGDSIRLGYQEAVRRELAPLAHVWAPEGNGMHSLHHLFHLSWYTEQPADVIHFNFGLWDCRRIGAARDDNAVPEALFARNLDIVLETARAATDAALIWATITPVVEARYNARFPKARGPRRDASDNVRYNAAAAPVLARHRVQVNDLHAFVRERGTERLVGGDGVHLTEEGYESVGRRVAARIRAALGETQAQHPGAGRNVSRLRMDLPVEPAEALRRGGNGRLLGGIDH